ncbi:hypothetical protein K8I61_14870, partial [bacterium]|nr:hypothetical protein [bacterium]
CVAYLVRRRMTEHPARLARVRFFYIHPLKGDVQAVLAAIARAGHADRDEDAAGAMRAGLERLPDLDDGAAPAPGREIAFEALAHALDRLGASSMGIRRKVIDACAHAAFADKWITVDEAEMLRVVSAALGCPLPPFVETWETRE